MKIKIKNCLWVFVIVIFSIGMVFSASAASNSSADNKQKSAVEQTTVDNAKKKPVGISDTVNINTGTKKDLMRLDRIGPKTAEAIIQYRKAHKFETKEELKKVKGVGDKIFEMNKEMIVVK